MSAFEIRRVVFGRSTLPESLVFAGGDPKAEVPIRFYLYLIRFGARLLCVDAGCVTMPGFVMHDFDGAIHALKAVGVQPSDVTDLFLTHSHHDHTECVGEFKNATVYIQSAEYEKCKRRFPADLHVKCFDDGTEIAEGIRAVKIGGHTVGSSILEVDADGETIVFAGDECYNRRCLTERILPGRPYSAENSRRFLEHYANGDYRILLAHDD